MFRRPAPDPTPDPTDAELRLALAYEASNGRTDVSQEYMTHTRILLARDPNLPDRSDPVAWAEFALEHRGDFGFAATYTALTGPFRAVFGPQSVHPDDDNPGFTDQPDAWKRWADKDAS